MLSSNLYGEAADTSINYDFECRNDAGQVWNNVAMEWQAWDSLLYQNYRIPATESGGDGSGIYTATKPEGTARYRMRARGATLDLSYVVWTEDLSVKRIIEADQIIEDDNGPEKLKTYERGTSTELIPAKTARQPNGEVLTNPNSQRLAGYRE